MADQSFYFYDLETSGVSPRSARIMQFAGQRTDAELRPIGDPDNILIKLHEDILPEPDAVLITGITPQMTLVDGMTEAEFFKYFSENIALPGTIFTGFNSVRFDDEFMRFGLFRNYYEPYEWQWKNDASRWDLLDVVRLTRALRPEGIQWPFASDGKPTNRLELLTSLNGLDHENAHDALNDVLATIKVAMLIKEKQPKMFDYVLGMRSKKAVTDFLAKNKMFIYVSGKYNAAYEKMTVVCSLGSHPQGNGEIVFDLRYDPLKFINLTPAEMVSRLQYNPDSTVERLPVKSLQYNRCPAISPIGVLRPDDCQRLEVDLAVMQQRCDVLRQNSAFAENVSEAYRLMNKDRSQTTMMADPGTAETLLYDGFIDPADKQLMTKMHRLPLNEQQKVAESMSDSRLKAMFPIYKARNHPKELTDLERRQWEEYKAHKINQQIDRYMKRLTELAERPGVTQNQRYLLEELQLYAESVVSEY